MLGEVVDHLRGALRIARVELREPTLEDFRGDHHRLHRRAQRTPRLANRRGGDPGPHPQLDHLANATRGDQALCAREVVGDRPDEARVELPAEHRRGALRAEATVRGRAHCGATCGAGGGVSGVRPGTSGGTAGWPGASGASWGGSCGPGIDGKGI